jgi:hypothetical protein
MKLSQNFLLFLPLKKLFQGQYHYFKKSPIKRQNSIYNILKHAISSPKLSLFTMSYTYRYSL